MKVSVVGVLSAASGSVMGVHWMLCILCLSAGFVPAGAAGSTTPSRRWRGWLLFSRHSDSAVAEANVRRQHVQAGLLHLLGLSHVDLHVFPELLDGASVLTLGGEQNLAGGSSRSMIHEHRGVRRRHRREALGAAGERQVHLAAGGLRGLWQFRRGILPAITSSPPVEKCCPCGALCARP